MRFSSCCLTRSRSPSACGFRCSLRLVRFNCSKVCISFVHVRSGRATSARVAACFDGARLACCGMDGEPAPFCLDDESDSSAPFDSKVTLVTAPRDPSPRRNVPSGTLLFGGPCRDRAHGYHGTVLVFQIMRASVSYLHERYTGRVIRAEVDVASACPWRSCNAFVTRERAPSAVCFSSSGRTDPRIR